MLRTDAEIEALRQHHTQVTASTSSIAKKDMTFLDSSLILYCKT